MKKFTGIALISTLLLSLGFVTSCDKKAKYRKQMKKYGAATRLIWDSEVSEFNATTKWIVKFDDKKKDEYKKGIGKRLGVYKGLIEKLEKVEAPNKAIEKIKKLDVESLKARRDIIKLWRDQINKDKKPGFGVEYNALNSKYHNLVKERERLRREYYKKYAKGKKSKRRKKWKKKRKKRK